MPSSMAVQTYVKHQVIHPVRMLMSSDRLCVRMDMNMLMVFLSKEEQYFVSRRKDYFWAACP